MDVKVPNLSEGVESGTVVSILVNVGDSVEKDQTIIELETDKAVAPIPSTESGKVSSILVKEGDKVGVGQSIISLDSNGAGASTVETPKESAPQAQPAQPQAPLQAQQPAVSQGNFQYQSPSGMPPAASPSVRKVARDLGIDLTRVRGTEAGGRISLHDLRDYVQGLQSLASSGAQVVVPQAPAPQAPQAPKEQIDFSKWGTVRKESVSSLRKTIGERMYQSWNTIPHVTQFDEVDITDLLKLRKKLLPKFEKEGVRLTVTGLILKALIKALKEHPIFNSSLDEVTNEVVYKDYFHLGIAVDTDSGLIVPVLKDVDKKNLVEVSKELSELAEKTRNRKVGVEDLKGGSFTVSNLGGVGGTHFTPIINKPEVAILALGKGQKKPVVGDKDKIEVRMMVPIGVSYDHRVIDGADGARFITTLVNSIQNLNEKDLGV